MRRGVSFGVLAGALWGTVFLAPALIPTFSPIEASVGRFLAYGAVSLLIALPSARALLAKLTRGDLVLLLQLALAGNIVYYCFLGLAVRFVGIAPTSLIIGTLPVTITLLGAWQQRKRNALAALPLRRLAPPLATIVLGIACINVDVFAHLPSAQGSGWRSLVGIAAAVAALACWTWFAVANAQALRTSPRFTGNQWSLIWGVVTGALSVLIWLVLTYLPTPAAQAIGIHSQTPQAWELFWIVNLALAVGASWLGNALWNAASRRLSVTLSGQMIVFETLFALLYGFAFEGRLPRVLELSAIALLLIGVLWSVRLHAADEVAAPLPAA